MFADEIAHDDRIHLVGLADGVVVGHAAAWVDGSIGRVTNVAVRDSVRGSGTGSMLFARLLRSVLACERVDRLCLEVRSDNRSAQRLYVRFGFAPVGVERDFYDRGPNRDALVMTVTEPRSARWLARLDDCEQAAA